MSAHGFGDLVADAHHRIEGGHRLLEDHGDARAAELTEFILAEGRKVRGLRRSILKTDVARVTSRLGEAAP